jgi:hypothetical protein
MALEGEGEEGEERFRLPGSEEDRAEEEEEEQRWSPA